MEREEARLADLRRRLGEALEDPQRRQLAHIAILDIAMAVRAALEGRGVGEPDVARATEEISALLKGEINDLPQDLANPQVVLDVLAETLRAATQNRSFARVFGQEPPSP